MSDLALDSRVVFLGQAVRCPGTAMFTTLEDVPMDQRIELPVAEEMQMGMATGLAMSGYIPVCVFPRLNFLLLAINQLVNHLDKMQAMSSYQTRVIIRTSVGSERPLHPGSQHVGNFCAALRLLCSNIWVKDLKEADQIYPSYVRALEHPSGHSTILIEHGDYYGEK